MRIGTAAVIVAGLIVGIPTPSGGQEPDSVVVIAPVMVRILRSTVGTGTPFAVSVSAGPELTRGTSGAFLEEALRAVPGVQIQNRYNLAVGERLSIRGFGARAQFGVRGVRVLVDDIPATLPDGQSSIDHLDLSGLGRVEALRGPASALYGNAAGGVIHFRSLEAPARGTQVSARTAAGTHGLVSAQGSVAGRAGDASYRVSFSRLSYDGFRRDPVADDGSTYGSAERSVVNGSVALPTMGGTLRFIANGLDLNADNPGSLSGTLLANGDREAFRFNVLNGTGKEIRQGQIGASWKGPLAGTDATFSTWGVRRELLNPIPGTVVGVDRNAGGLRALFEGSRPGANGAFSYGAGIEVELQGDDRKNWVNESGESGALTLSQQESVRGAGMFAQGRADFAGGFSALAGLRYDRIRFSATDRFVAPGNPDDSGARTMDAVSPSLGLMFTPADRVEFFGSVARSFETPTTTELANRPTSAGGFNPTLAPQRALTVEGGVRARVAGALALEGTLFRTQIDDELVPFEVPSDPGRTYFQNAGESLHTGWEVAVDTRLGGVGSTRLAYTRVNGRFERFTTDDADYGGNSIPGLAPYRVDALATFDIGPAWIEVRGLYQDAMPVDNAGTASSPAYFVGDLRAGLDEARLGRTRLAPFLAVANVFDRRYNASVVVNAFGSRYFEPGPGRTYQIGLGVTWER